MSTIKIPAGLRGSIYRRGKASYRVQLPLGRGPDGEYEVKRETVRGRQQDAIDLLTRWNVQYLDNTIQATVYQTVKEAYDEWIRLHVDPYLMPNTRRFYKERFTSDILPEIGHIRLKDISLGDLQKTLTKYPTKDKHNKRAISAFFNWCTDMSKIPNRHDFRKLKTKARIRGKAEKDVWNFDEVRRIYSVLTFDNLYDIFIVLGVECGLRPQEILALTWDKIRSDHLIIDQAVKERTPTSADIGTTKNERPRYVAITAYLWDKLTLHQINQQIRIANTAGYDTETRLVVADSMGHVPDITYIRKYVQSVTQRAGVHYIPPKNFRSTYISLMNALGIPLTLIQEAAGHSSPEITSRHYIRIFDRSLKEASEILYNRLHGDSPDP